MSSDDKSGGSEMQLEGVPVFAPGELMRMLEVMILGGLPVLLTSSPGQGKTDIVRQVCKLLGIRLVVRHPVVDSPVDYKGMPAVLRGSGDVIADFLPFGDLRVILKGYGDDSERLVYFADDIGQAPMAVQCAFGQLMLTRSLGSYEVKDGVVFVSATNRARDRAGVSAVISMLLDRYVSVVELVNNVKDWSRWAVLSGVDDRVISWVRFTPGVFTEFDPKLSARLERSVTPRGIEQCSRMLGAGLSSDLWYRAFGGAIGLSWSAELVAYLGLYGSLPDPDVVLLDPDGAVVPSEASECYAMCGALASRVDRRSFANFLKYLSRMPKEFEVLGVQDAILYDASLSNTRDFEVWVKGNEGVLVR